MAIIVKKVRGEKVASDGIVVDGTEIPEICEMIISALSKNEEKIGEIVDMSF